MCLTVCLNCFKDANSTYTNQQNNDVELHFFSRNVTESKDNTFVMVYKGIRLCVFTASKQTENRHIKTLIQEPFHCHTNFLVIHVYSLNTYLPKILRQPFVCYHKSNKILILILTLLFTCQLGLPRLSTILLTTVLTKEIYKIRLKLLQFNLSITEFQGIERIFRSLQL